MSDHSKESFRMKVFPKGQVVIPISLRKKYHIDIGDQINVETTPEGILLKPLPKESRKRSLTDRLFGIFNAYASGKPKPTEKDIARATETGFIEGWKK